MSTMLFFGAFAIMMTPAGAEPYGAGIKFALWGVALLVEMVSHIIRFQLEIDQGIRLRSHRSVTGRLRDITIIILGEVGRRLIEMRWCFNAHCL